MWTQARAALDGLGAGHLNIAHEAVDRHTVGPAGSRIALRCLRADGSRSEVTYRQLRQSTSRFANALTALGVQGGDSVFTLLGRVPELYVAVLGSLRMGAVVSPMFTAFGPEPLRQRMLLGSARVVVTTETLYRRRLEPVRAELPDLEFVLLVSGDPTPTTVPGTLDLATLMDQASADHTIAATQPDDPALVHFTSGTTGTPKGALHVHEAVVAHHATAMSALDLAPGDVYWCTADPGWVTGTSYGIVAPLAVGATVVVDEAEFDARRWFTTLTAENVDVWYTAPTALRMLMRAGPELASEFDLGGLRHAASVGEPLNAEVVRWGAEVLGVDIHDTWWQTETGAIMVANPPDVPVVPGSMGVPVPGITCAVAIVEEPVADDVSATVQIIESAEADGQLVVRTPWPSMFRDYLGEPDRYRRCFADGWYLTGDLVQRDASGNLWFVGRVDDVIKSAGHLVGPFEVESVLLEHPAVAEAGVIGIPDPTAGEMVKAFVTLNHGFTASDELVIDLRAAARSRLGPAVAPRFIEVVDDLPHTRSGKVMRRLLRARELGLPTGDLSTLERPMAEGAGDGYPGDRRRGPGTHTDSTNSRA